ncbi:unnamed protein product [Moneuplotes crassus]|uniref:Uncharacterized protein n=1 Tax=Euplotes crassus TaxID=5936 RepID=A0AAD1Y9Y1_EUPCR|nr:unnamed protein product [Moneuplotes crassus]
MKRISCITCCNILLISSGASEDCCDLGVFEDILACSLSTDNYSN